MNPHFLGNLSPSVSQHVSMAEKKSSSDPAARLARQGQSKQIQAGQAGSEQANPGHCCLMIFTFSDFLLPFRENRVKSRCPGYFRFESNLTAQCSSRRADPFPQDTLNPE